MQDILLPLLVLNLLLTFWLLRQHILRQGRRHQRREELAEWRAHVDLRLKQHFESLVNHSEIFLEHRSSMAEIDKDHYALNERLDGISVYDIKAILAGQERLQMLESDIEAIKDIINPHGEKISYLESIIHTAKVHDNFSGRSLWETATLDAAVGDLRNDFLRLERDLTVISQSNLSVNDRTCKLESSITSIETTFDDFGRRFNDLWALRNSHEMLSATVETLRMQHFGLSEDLSQTKVRLDNRIVDLENGAKPFNPDTLIDSPESNRQEETADPVGYLERLKKKPNTDYTHDIIP